MRWSVTSASGEDTEMGDVTVVGPWARDGGSVEGSIGPGARDGGSVGGRGVRLKWTALGGAECDVAETPVRTDAGGTV